MIEKLKSLGWTGLTVAAIVAAVIYFPNFTNQFQDIFWVKLMHGLGAWAILMAILLVMNRPFLREAARPLRDQLEAMCQTWLPKANGHVPTLMSVIRARRARKRAIKAAMSGEPLPAGGNFGETPTTPPVSSPAPLTEAQSRALSGFAIADAIYQTGIILAVTWVIIYG